jgi:hypothetical protein
MFRAALVEGNLAAIALWGAVRLAGGSPNFPLPPRFARGGNFYVFFTILPQNGSFC